MSRRASKVVFVALSLAGSSACTSAGVETGRIELMRVFSVTGRMTQNLAVKLERAQILTGSLDAGCFPCCARRAQSPASRSEEHTSELQSLMRISYAVFCLKKKKTRP